jgi:Flp pilus assembly protein TadG
LDDRSGTSAVEFALVVPVFLVMLLGIIEFGRVVWTQSALQHAVEAAARCAVVTPSQCGTTSQVQNYAAGEVFGLSVPASAFSLASPSCGTQVSVSVSFSFVASALFPYNITLSAKSCHP